MAKVMARITARMRRAAARTLLSGLLTVLAMVAPSYAAETRAGELVVRFRSDVEAGERAAARSAAEVAIQRGLPLSGAQVVKVERGQSVADAELALESRPEVLYAEPNYAVHSSATPDDPLFSQLWGLRNVAPAGAVGGVDVDAPGAWDLATGSRGVLVALVDTAVDFAHPDLAPAAWQNPGESGAGRESNGLDDDGNGKVDDWRGWDFSAGDNDPTGLEVHGTHVAGTIGANGNDGYGTTGVNWQVSLAALRVLDANGAGSSAGVAAAFAYAGQIGAKVVNVSLGGPGSSQAVDDAVAASPETLFVVAAGNSGLDNDAAPQFPCNVAHENLICVAASDQADGLASFSNRGAVSVDLAAPGVSILSTYPGVDGNYTDGNDFATLSGTSMATPHVAGAAGLLFAAQPSATVAQVRSALLAGVDRVPGLEGATVTGGRLDVAAALRTLTNAPAPSAPAVRPTPRAPWETPRPATPGQAAVTAFGRVVRNGRLPVSLRCAGTPAQSCRGQAQLVTSIGHAGQSREAVIGRASFALPGTRSQTVSLALNGVGRRLLRKHHRIRVAFALNGESASVARHAVVASPAPRPRASGAGRRRGPR